MYLEMVTTRTSCSVRIRDFFLPAFPGRSVLTFRNTAKGQFRTTVVLLSKRLDRFRNYTARLARTKLLSFCYIYELFL
jgi:hypothetical protein